MQLFVHLRRALTGACLLTMAVLVTGCSDEGGGIDPFADLPAATPSASMTAGATPTAATGVPEQCDDVISPSAVLDALGVALDGTSSFVTAGPVPSSGRTGRITCNFGVAPGADGKPAAKVALTINGYQDADTARSRLDTSISNAQSQGQQVQALDLQGRPGYVVRDPVDISYLLADGDRTVVVTMVLGLVPAEAEQIALTEIATAMVGAAPIVPSPSPTAS